MKLSILGIGVAAILYLWLILLMDARGAIPFVKPFHAGGVVLTVLLANLLFVKVSGFKKIAQKPGALTACYIMILFVIWFFALPLGDFSAELRERSIKSASDVGDMGYGWFYWDDSGMGNWPMTFFNVVVSTLIFPVFHVLLAGYIYLCFRYFGQCDKDASENKN